MNALDKCSLHPFLVPGNVLSVGTALALEGLTVQEGDTHINKHSL